MTTTSSRAADRSAAVMHRRRWAVVRRGRRHQLAAAAVLAAVYYAAAHVGYALDIAGPVAAIIWLPAGVSIAFLTVGGTALWPGVLVGDLLVNDYGALPVGTALVQTCGNVLEALVAAMLIRRLAARRPPLGSAAGLGGLLVAIAAGVAVSATIGVTAQLAGGVIETGAAGTVWRTWWLGDAAGAVTIVPLVLAWRDAPPRTWLRPARLVEAAILLVAAFAIAELVFRSRQPLTWLTFPALIWAALRFRQWGATTVSAITAGVCTWSTAHFAGPFVFDSITHSVVSAQLFILVPTITTLALAIVVSERESFAARLSASRARLVAAASMERLRLERNLHDGAQQRLTALGIQIAKARRELAEEGAAAADASLVRAEADLDEAVDELRELARGIHPAALTEGGLAGAMDGIAARSAIPVLTAGLPRQRLDGRLEVTAYYVIAEAVTNAQKHAAATLIRIRGDSTSGGLRLEIDDDGRGGAREVPGSGLEGLRDRVEAIGGTFVIDSPPGRGTRIAVELPAGAMPHASWRPSRDRKERK